MGGAVTVLLRQHDGAVLAMQRWTNPLSFWVAHPDLIEDQDDHFARFVSAIRSEQVGVPAAPADYGMVVVDRQSRSVLTYQGYSTFRVLPLMQLVSLAEPPASLVKTGFAATMAAHDQERQAERDRFQRLIDQGRLYTTNLMTERSNEVETWSPLRVHDVDGAIAAIKAMMTERLSNEREWLHLCVDLRPWSYRWYEPHDYKDGEKLKSDLIEMGFWFSERDEAGWAEWFEKLRTLA